MANAIENLKAAIDALTTADEVRQGWDLLKARSNRIAAKAVLSFNPGDRVTFKGKYGVTEVGTVQDVNQKTVTVMTDSGKGWRVAPSLLSILTLENKPPVLSPKRSEKEILKDLLGVFCSLSPENLTCDGELPRSEVNRRSAKLNAEKRKLFAELGREVDESEVYRLTAGEARE